MIVTNEDLHILRSGLQQLELPADDEQVDWHCRYIRELQLWNRRVRLISGSPRDIIIRHILDSLAPWKLLRREMERFGGSRAVVSIADVGSGNGFPALVLAGLSIRGILPAADYYLVERGAKKAAFLRSTAGLLGLFDAVQVEETDVRQLQRRVDMVISRAFMPAGDAFSLLEPLLAADGGELCFYSGRRDTIDAQLEKLPDERKLAVEIEPVRVPFLEEERHLCRIYKPLR
ncbi:MAG: 16S rRNA (guanine(527)-N(7))-methyltransferase RsmG [Spirochaetota bacterium]